MNNDFVPFIASPPAPAPVNPGARPRIIAEPNADKCFHLIGTGPAATAPTAGAEPVVSLEREGDRVTRIKIRCRCGHTIELTCDYEANASAAGPSPAAPKP
jgi:hypothetical protein